MQMFRQQYKGVDGKWMVGFNQMERRSQQFPIFRFTEDFASPERHDRKK